MQEDTQQRGVAGRSKLRPAPPLCSPHFPPLVFRNPHSLPDHTLAGLIFARLLLSCMTLVSLFNLSLPQSPHLQNEANKQHSSSQSYLGIR